MPDSILVIDFGTTNFKAAVVGPDGRMSRVYRVASPITHPAPDRSEMQPEAFQLAITSAFDWLRQSRPQGLSDVGAISYSSQANTFMLLDESDKPLTPFIVWTDERAKQIDSEAVSWTDDSTFSAITGLPSYSAMFSPPKMMWIARTEPQMWGRMRRVCWLGDYFAHWATGHRVTDASVAGMSGIYDVPRGQWSPELSRKAGISIDALPGVLRSGSIAGALGDDFANEHGLPPGCKFVVGILDQHAGAIGAGSDQPGGCSETTGTVLATVRCADQFSSRSDGSIFRGPAADERLFFHMTFGSVSANLLQFLRDQLPDRPGFEMLDSMAEIKTLKLKSSDAPEDLQRQILSWVGQKDVGQVVGAIYAVVADALADLVGALFIGESVPETIRSAGGAARSRKWLQLKADRLQRTMIAPLLEEPTLLGAAILAGPAVGAPILPPAVEESQVVRPRS